MRIIQTVEYTPNSNNAEAADLIIKKAAEILGVIEGTRLQIGKALPSDRQVVISNGTVIKQTSWNTPQEKEAYFRHPNLRLWCEFVLNGWQLADSEATSKEARKDEFIDHILNGKEQKDWKRDADVPESEVVWNSEKIQIFQVERDNADISSE